MKKALLFVLAAAATFAQAQISPDRVLVVVNGQKITGASYYKRMEFLPNVGKLVGDQFLPAMPGFLALETLINETLMIQLATDKGVAPTNAQIDEEIARRLKQNPDFMKAFTMLGLTQADMEYDIRVQLSEFNLTTMGINITDFQVEKYYQENTPMFTVPKRYRLRLIAVTTDAEKAAVDADLAAGKDFAEVAKKHSKHVTNGNGGLMGDLPEDAIGENIKAIVKGLKEGQSTPWMENQGETKVKVFLEKIYPQEVMKLDDDLKYEIRQNMMLTRGRVKNDVAQMMANKRKATTFEFQGTPFDEQLKKLYGK